MPRSGYHVQQHYCTPRCTPPSLLQPVKVFAQGHMPPRLQDTAWCSTAPTSAKKCPIPFIQTPNENFESASCGFKYHTSLHIGVSFPRRRTSTASYQSWKIAILNRVRTYRGRMFFDPSTGDLMIKCLYSSSSILLFFFRTAWRFPFFP